MKKISSSSPLWAIIVGNLGDEFVSYTEQLLNSYRVEAVICEDIYSAVCKLTINRGKDILVIGRIEHMSVEKGRFFDKAQKNNVSCCCLVNKVSQGQQVLMAKEKGAFVVNGPEQLKELVTEMVSDGEALKNKRSTTFDKDEFAMTQAELDALLGI